MASDAWGRSSTSAKRSPFQSDPFSEEEDMAEELRPEYTCPFCTEDFDMVGLCCHLDEVHAAEAKNGVCPICQKMVGTDFVGHITTQHDSLLKVQRMRYYRKGSPLTLIRKELREGNLHNVAGGSNWAAAANNTNADPLLSSFMYNSPTNDKQTSTEPRSSEKAPSVEETIIQSSSERNHEGNLVEAFSKCNQGRINPEMAEAIGVREALSWIKKKNWRDVEVETDSLVSVQAIRSKSVMLSYFGRIIEECKKALEELKDSNISLRNVQQPVLSDKEYEERTRRSEFVRGLLMSTFLDDEDGF